MRPATRAMLGVVLTTLCCGQVIAVESKSAWWPFGGAEETAVPPIATAPPLETQTVPASESKSWLEWPSLPKASMPKPSMPKMSWPSLSSHDDAAATTAVTTTPPTTAIEPITPVGPRRPAMRLGKASHHAPHRNSWAKPEGEQPDVSPWQAMTDGARRVGDSTAAAWHKTVDAVTPGDSASATTAAPQVAQQAPKESWWSRIRGGSDAQPEGPRTVTEWMAQERLDP